MGTPTAFCILGGPQLTPPLKPACPRPQMYRDDGMSRADIAKLVGRFSSQSLDFFGAIRASTYDAQIRTWLRSIMGEPRGARVCMGGG